MAKYSFDTKFSKTSTAIVALENIFITLARQFFWRVILC